MNWYVGQKIVCINNSGCPELSKEKVYIILEIDQCPNCNEIGIVISHNKQFKVSNYSGFAMCGQCKRRYPNVYPPFYSYSIKRFRPLQWEVIPNLKIIKKIFLKNWMSPKK